MLADSKQSIFICVRINWCFRDFFLFFPSLTCFHFNLYWMWYNNPKKSEYSVQESFIEKVLCVDVWCCYCMSLKRKNIHFRLPLTPAKTSTFILNASQLLEMNVIFGFFEKQQQQHRFTQIISTIINGYYLFIANQKLFTKMIRSLRF